MVSVNGPSSSSQERLELRLSNFLRWGVVVSGVFLALGWLLELRDGIRPLSELSLAPHVQLIEKWRWWEGVWSGPVDLIYLGLLVLILLPLLRVLMTFFLLLRQRDFLLAAAAAFVLLVLVFSFVLGFET